MDCGARENSRGCNLQNDVVLRTPTGYPIEVLGGVTKCLCVVCMEMYCVEMMCAGRAFYILVCFNFK